MSDSTDYNFPSVHSVGPLPTPPFSPQCQDPFLPTRNLLDSLVAFYHQERMWVYRTRASLEFTYDDPQSPTSPERAPSSSTDETSLSVVKTEQITPSSAGPTPWARRKQSFKLRLDGIPNTRGRRKPQPSPAVRQPPEPGVQILELFENMMEARMESCQRVNKLVRKANRADLYVR